MVNNAGLGGTAPVVEMTDEQWDRVLDVTLTGRSGATRAALRTCRAPATGSDRQQRLGARLAGPGRAGALRRGQGRRDGADPVRAVERRPRYAGQRRVARAWRCTRSWRRRAPRLLDELTEREAFGRAAEPWEVANVIVFLASDYSCYLTGEVVSVSAAPMPAGRPPHGAGATSFSSSPRRCSPSAG